MNTWFVPPVVIPMAILIGVAIVVAVKAIG